MKLKFSIPMEEKKHKEWWWWWRGVKFLIHQLPTCPKACSCVLQSFYLFISLKYFFLSLVAPTFKMDTMGWQGGKLWTSYVWNAARVAEATAGSNIFFWTHKLHTRIVWMAESWRDKHLPQIGKRTSRPQIRNEDFFRSFCIAVGWDRAELDVCWILGLLKWKFLIFSTFKDYPEQLHIHLCQIASMRVVWFVVWLRFGCCAMVDLSNLSSTLTTMFLQS